MLVMVAIGINSALVMVALVLNRTACRRPGLRDDKLVIVPQAWTATLGTWNSHLREIASGFPKIPKSSRYRIPGNPRIRAGTEATTATSEFSPTLQSISTSN